MQLAKRLAALMMQVLNLPTRSGNKPIIWRIRRTKGSRRWEAARLAAGIISICGLGMMLTACGTPDADEPDPEPEYALTLEAKEADEPAETSTPRPTATDFPSASVAVKTANVRSGPGTDHSVIGTASEGDLLQLLAANEDGSWLNVRLPGGEDGWISASLVDADGSMALVSEAATIPAPPAAAPQSTNPSPPTAVPAQTDPPAPAAPPAAAASDVRIAYVDKRTEYVDITNFGGTDQDLGGWMLRSEKGNQDCGLGGVLPAGASLRIWAMASDAGNGGFNCGFGSDIWNNSSSDPAVLYDNTGREVSRY